MVVSQYFQLGLLKPYKGHYLPEENYDILIDQKTHANSWMRKLFLLLRKKSRQMNALVYGAGVLGTQVYHLIKTIPEIASLAL